MYSVSNGGSLRIRITSRLPRRMSSAVGQLEPALGVVENPHPAAAAERFAVADAQVILFKVMQLHAALLGLQHHGETAVLRGIDAGDGIHDDAEANGLRTRCDLASPGNVTRAAKT